MPWTRFDEYSKYSEREGEVFQGKRMGLARWGLVRGIKSRRDGGGKGL